MIWSWRRNRPDKTFVGSVPNQAGGPANDLFIPVSHQPLSTAPLPRGQHCLPRKREYILTLGNREDELRLLVTSYRASPSRHYAKQESNLTLYVLKLPGKWQLGRLSGKRLVELLRAGTTAYTLVV